MWSLGCMNPTGLMHKSSTLSQLPARGNAVWGVSETHLTKPGVAQFCKELHFSGSNFRFHAGAPAPFKSTALSAIGGKQTGTGFLTQFPSRSLTHTWPSETWDTARFCAHTFLVENEWIHGAVVYGPAHNAASQQGKQRTDELLTHITKRIVQQAAGKRFIMGDLNQLRSDMQQVAIWESLGWKEVQVWRAEQKGLPIEVTCRGTTTKDFIFVSPELLPWLEEVEVVHDIYPDHSVVAAHFRPLGPPAKVALWKKPRPIDWPKRPCPLPQEPEPRAQDSDPDVECQSIARAFECRVQQARQASKLSPLHPSQCGRSTTKEVKWKPAYTNPLKPSRQGDSQPKFGGISLQFNRWFRQLRRLENYARHSSNPQDSQGQRTHRDRLWRAIMHAPGFHKGFAHWWTTIPKHMDTPAVLQWHPPCTTEAHSIHLCFETAFRHYEQTLINDRVATSRANRLSDPGLIFQDVRKPAVNPVQVLQTTVEAEITEVDIATGILTLNKPVSFDLNQPIIWDGGMQPITHLEDTQIAVPDATDCHPGMTVHQESYIGELTQMFQAFADEWQTRWDRHRDVHPNHWDPIMQFFRAAVPEGEPMPYTLITPERWYKTLARKKKKAAIGPDGWARQDLLQLPEDLTRDLIHLIHRIEAGLPWPTSVVTGIVFALEKLPGARSVTQYRPITVFSLIYRTWSSLRAKEMLVHLQRYAPSTCFGNLPNRHASQVWWNIQTLIESHNYEGTAVSGCMMDVIKCFNHLPREPLLQMCLHLGAPQPVITAWKSALQTMTRRFSIRGSVGPAIQSTTGFAEGCGLSVVAMLVCNIALGAWIQARAPICTLWTFVDNIELTSPSAQDTIFGLEQVTRFTQLLDIQLDANKTFVWSNSAEDRQWFRANMHQVREWARDLGGHVQYTKSSTNGVIVSKCLSFQDRWRQFARSHSPQHIKLQAVRSVAWPNIFHGIASVHLGLDLFDTQRTAVLRGLQIHHSGTSPRLQLSLLEFPTADPEFYAIWRTVLEFRRNVTCEAACPILDSLIECPAIRPPPGPCSVLLHRLHRVLWSWQGEGKFRDHQGLAVRLWFDPIQWIKRRLTEAWQQLTMGELAKRKSFRGFAQMNPRITMKAMPTQPIARGILQTAMNGTFFTADFLEHRTPDADLSCKFCGDMDNQVHRHWQCPYFNDVRPLCPPELRNVVAEMPGVTAAHGWIPSPTSLETFEQALHLIPDTTDHFQPIQMDTTLTIELFSDGGAVSPNEPLARLASWGVAATTTGSLNFQPVGCGLVTGGHQTVLRAELTGLIAALKFAEAIHSRYRLWIDNAEVVRTIQTWIHNQPVDSHETDVDLWQEALLWFRRTHQSCRGIVKVYSHQDCTAATEAEQWAFAGNNVADHLASTAIHGYPHLRDLQRKVQTDLTLMAKFRSHVHGTLIAVGNKALEHQRNTGETTKAGDECAEDVPRLLPTPNRWPFTPRSLEDHPQYYLPQWHKFFHWLDSLYDDSAPSTIVSWFQIYADYLQFADQPGPWFNRSRKKWELLTNREPTKFQNKSRWLSNYITRFSKKLGHSIQLLHCRPTSHVIGFWTSCVLMKMPLSRLQAADRWFQQWQPAFRRAPELHQIGAVR